MAALLKNDRPGVRFAATDLVRNLLMSPFMDRSLLQQNMFILKQYRASRYGLNIQFRTLEEQEEQVETVSAKLAVQSWKLRNKEKSKFYYIWLW